MTTFIDQLADAWPPDSWRDVTTIVGVSGGADSVALICGLKQLQVPGPGRIVVAHFNHRMRGQESTEDEHFVQQLACQLGLDAVCGASPEAWKNRTGQGGVEATARQMRYDFFADVAGQTGARYLALGHNANDQAETVLHHILRGTAIAGLAGIPRLRRLSELTTLIRPLRDVKRSEIIAYLNSRRQPFRHDRTNDDLSLTRNRIRHDLLPLLTESYNANVVEALLRLSNVANDTTEMTQNLAQMLLDECLAASAVPSRDLAVLDCRAFKGTHQHLVRQVFVQLWVDRSWPRQDMAFLHWQQLADLALVSDLDAGQTLTLPGPVQVMKEGAQLTLTRQRDAGSPNKTAS